MTCGSASARRGRVTHRSRVAAALALASTCAIGCSPSSGPESTVSSVSPSAAAGDVAVQAYLDTVNELCDALLPKVVAVTNGGSFDIPLKDFFAQLPAHAKLRADFDRDLKRVAVPPVARGKAAVLDAYIRYANRLDARRLAAAKRGPAAYVKEIRTELKYAASDPTITARNAAGFHDSCNAR